MFFYIRKGVEMKIKFILLCLLIIIKLDQVSFAENVEPDMINAPESFARSANISSNEQGSSLDEKNIFHLTIGGSYSSLNNNYGKWKSIDLGLQYSGLKKFTPSCSIARLTRKEGSQYVYGLGSYINVNSKFYMTAGISGAPVKDPGVILYPRLRLDMGGFFSQSIIDGLVINAGVTHFPKHNGGSGDIFSLGGIYYWKVIFQGTVSYNISRPGNIDSLSGQASFMYGQEGKHWLGGGINRGRQAYELPTSDRPFQVRFRGYGASLFYIKWFGKDWGINTRLEVGRLVGAYEIVGINTGLFFDF